MRKIKQKIVENKKAMIGGLISIGGIAIISLILYSIMAAFGLTTIAGLQGLVAQAGVWSWLVFIVLQVIVTTLLCFVPGTSMMFAVLGNILFNNGSVVGIFSTFSIILSGVIISSQIMFLLGKYGGEKLAIKLIGEKEVAKAQKLMETKTKVFLPIMYLLTFFPDDALCFVAGMQKMNFWRHLIYVVIFRGVGTLTVCLFGANFFDYGSFSLVEWFMFISVAFFWVMLFMVGGYKLSNKLENKKTIVEIPLISQEVEDGIQS